MPTIAQRRLLTQRLAGPKFAAPAEVVAHFGAVQAQEYLPALWAVGQRTVGATEAIIEQAILDRQLVRTWPLRGTIHFVTPADIRWLLALSALRQLRMTPRQQQLGLDEAMFAQSRRVVAGALSDGQPRPRPELRQALDDAGISTAGQRGIHILARLAQEGLICIGPRQGKQHTFVLLDAWLPPARTLTRDEALAELARRYFVSHGPATLKDYTWWSGLAAAEARAGLAMVKGQLERDVVGREEYWFAAPPVGELPSSSAHLLPFYDEYLVAYKDRRAVLPSERNALADFRNIIFHQPILVDGRVAGAWLRELKADTVILRPTLFQRLTGAERNALGAAAERYGAFLGLRAELVMT